MIRTILYLALVLALGGGAAWLADHPGDVRIDWQGQRIETSMAFIALSAAAALVAGMLTAGLWGWARREMPFVGANRHLARQRRGLEALNQSVIALAAGDARTARRLSDRARRLLPPQPVTHVLAAQAARLSGDEKAAQAEFQALLDDPSAAFIGLRGLLTGAMREGRTRDALKLAEEAFAESPKSPWAAHTLFGLQARAGKWAAAGETLARAEKLGAFGKDDSRRHRAALLFERAREAEAAGDHDQAQKLLKQVLRLREGFPPAVALMARLHTAAGKLSTARSMIAKAWTGDPHPQTLAAFLDLDPVERPTERFRRVKKLVKGNADSAESRLAVAAAALQAEHFDEAREQLDALLGETPVLARTYRTEADFLRRRGGAAEDIAVAETRAREARDYRWTCGECGWAADAWSGVCPHCGAFDAQRWKLPDDSMASPATGGFEELLAPPAGLAAAMLRQANDAAGKSREESLPPPPDIEPPGAED